MRQSFKERALEICASKIANKGEKVGLSFYVFFSNKNDDPELLMEVAEWWILENKLDHFEKAVKIKKMLEALN